MSVYLWWEAVGAEAEGGSGEAGPERRQRAGLAAGKMDSELEH